MATTKQIQQRLIELGYNIGKAGADGVMGRNTINAIAKFQKDKNLDIQFPGTVGPKTIKALDLEKPNADIVVLPPWVAEAKRYIGLHEKRDAKTLDKALRLDASEIAWCGAFVGMVIAATLPKEPLPANMLGSRNWLKFGKDLKEPKLGAIAVFWRGSKDGWQGHVGIVVGHDKNYLHILGGNQSDSVSIVKISKSRLLGYRYPTTYAEPDQALAYSVFNGTISVNEA